MNSHRRTAIIVGVLFIIATATTILAIIFLESINDTDYLATVSANENKVLIGTLFWLIEAISVVAIPIIMFPILKKHNESLALGYVGARIFEAFFVVVGAISALLLLSLSQEFVSSGASDASNFQTSGALLLAAYDWTFILLDLPFCLGALILYYLLYHLKLIPRWLSVWGFIGAALWLAASPFLFSMFGIDHPSTLDLLAIPIAVQEMVFAAWLIVKGFNPFAIAPESTKTDINKV